MYRIKRKYAWWPTDVWLKQPTTQVVISNRIGAYKTIWLREYWIVEYAAIVSDYGGICIEVKGPWVYAYGDCLNKSDAQAIVNLKNQ